MAPTPRINMLLHFLVFTQVSRIGQESSGWQQHPRSDPGLEKDMPWERIIFNLLKIVWKINIWFFYFPTQPGFKQRIPFCTRSASSLWAVALLVCPMAAYFRLVKPPSKPPGPASSRRLMILLWCSFYPIFYVILPKAFTLVWVNDTNWWSFF